MNLLIYDCFSSTQLYQTRWLHVILLPVIIEFSRCISTYSSTKLELYYLKESNFQSPSSFIIATFNSFSTDSSLCFAVIVILETTIPSTIVTSKSRQVYSILLIVSSLSEISAIISVNKFFSQKNQISILHYYHKRQIQ